MHEPARKSEGKQTKINGFLCPFVWAVTRRCDPDEDGSSDLRKSGYKVGLLPQIIQWRKISHKYV